MPDTADGWELFSSKEGSESAAMLLARAACQAIDVIADGKVADAATNIEKAQKILEDARNAHQKFGANDSEPYHHSQRIIRDTLKHFLGDFEI